MTKTNQDKIIEFHEAFGLPVNHEIFLKDEKLNTLRMELIFEEFKEVLDALNFILDIEENEIGIFPIVGEIDPSHVAKELADLLYVTYGAAVAFGIDVDKVFSLVHESNMSKLGEDGKPKYRKDGKVLKGDNYRPPDLSRHQEWTLKNKS